MASPLNNTQKIQRQCAYSTSITPDYDEIFATATKFHEDESPKTLKVKDIKTSSDLSALKKNDPFMYHSIPAVRAKVMQGKSVDVSILAKASTETPVLQRKRRISCESIDGGALPSEEIIREMIQEAQREYVNGNGDEWVQ
eukprot:scaffold101316_cov56-Cyclotella_meneghiniana.AAC.2